jgi:hypothetical protein
MHRAAHHNKLLDAKECLRILGGGEGHIGQRANADDGYAVLRLFTQDTEHLLVGRGLAWGEVAGEGGRFRDRNRSIIFKESAPGLGGAQMGVL